MKMEKYKREANAPLIIWHISDTHGYHHELIIPERVDIVIHSGDASNFRDPYRNEPEMRSFLNWFAMLPIKHKIYVAGNHDSSIEKGLITAKDFQMKNIEYLFNDYCYVEGIKIWGSPHTPQFGQWSFMKNRSKLDKVWGAIPTDTAILVTHGPPKGVLDLTYNPDNTFEIVGDAALDKHIKNLQLSLVCFGHIHSNKKVNNAGILQLANNQTLYSNGSCVTDGMFGRRLTDGNLFTIDLFSNKVKLL